MRVFAIALEVPDALDVVSVRKVRRDHAVHQLRRSAHAVLSSVDDQLRRPGPVSTKQSTYWTQRHAITLAILGNVVRSVPRSAPIAATVAGMFRSALGITDRCDRRRSIVQASP
eukprot:8034851-Pyramimonas_sp.AAC.1